MNPPSNRTAAVPKPAARPSGGCGRRAFFSALGALIASPLLLRSARALELAALTVRGANGALACRVSSDGAVRTSSNALAGRVEADGDVRSASNGLLGKVHGDGSVRSASNGLLGKVHGDGSVRSASNGLLGRIEPDGDVRDASNKLVARIDGYAPSRRQLVAALLFFFESTTGVSLR